jgi:phage-related protein
MELQTMWTIEFFVKDNGRCPTQEFLDELSPSVDLPKIMNQFGRLEEHGYTLDRPHAAHLEDDIYELRAKTRNGQFRFFYFFFVGQIIIVTHGVKKKTQHIKPKDIKLAKEYRVIFYARHGK